MGRWGERQSLVGYSDGRRKFGAVAEAIRRVMGDHDGEASPAQDAVRCAEMLGGRVSRFTVGDHLLEHSYGDTARYEWLKRGAYRPRRGR